MDISLSPIIAIAGPTAVGKSALAIELAKKIDGEIISADSMQIYKELNIGTAKPSKNEMRDVLHHMIGIVSAKKPYTASQYVVDAKKCIEDITSRGKPVIVVGGTGMYLRGLLYGYTFESIEACDEIREKYQEFVDKNGNKALHALLKKANPQRASELHENDVKRVIRALEITELGLKEDNIPKKQDMLNHHLYVLETNRDVLYSRINKRVLEMVELGLIEEVEHLLHVTNLPVDCQAMRAIGYKEIVNCFQKNLDPKSAIVEIQQNSRNYAKRQLTYFRSMNPAHWLDVAHGMDNLTDVIVRRFENANGELSKS